MDFDTKLIEKTIENLKKRQFNAVYVPDGQRAMELIKTMAKPGDLAARSGSITLNQIGLDDFLKSGDFDCRDQARAKDEADKKRIVRRRFFADVFFSSANAIISDGRIYNEDGASTRVSALIYGPEKVVIVAGINKIVESRARAAARVKKVAPQNCKNNNFDTPCAVDGVCHDCFVPGRSCCTTAILNFSRIPGRINVIIVGEELGI